MPAELHDGYRALAAEGSRNFVLNQLEIGVDAWLLGRPDLSAAAFDPALDAIEAVFGHDAAAQRARSLWYDEGAKTFKGEPYERAMAFYYRGLLYALVGDLDNAGACFRGGMRQDFFAEEEQHRFDFASFLYLESWCASRLGNNGMAEEANRFLREIRPDCNPPAANANLLVVAETGTAPRKLADGVGHAQLVFRRGKGFAERKAWVKIDDRPETLLYPVEDVYWQASTRGGRPVDRILQGKLRFKETWNQAGTAMTDLGAAAMAGAATVPEGERGPAQALAGGLTGIGLVAGLAALNAKPRADTRHWRNLPDALHVGAFVCSPGPHQVRLRYGDAKGKSLGEQTFTITVPSPPKRAAALAWGRSPRQLWAGKVSKGGVP